jgi:outer membrane protein TolC
LLPALQQKVSQAEHLLATLEGDACGRQAPDIRLTGLSLPENLPVSLPSVLVRQRPDILSAEAQLHQASADIGVATAAMFPSFSLTGTYGTAGSSTGSLFGGAGRFWSVGPSIDIPVFEGGRLVRPPCCDRCLSASVRRTIGKWCWCLSPRVADVLKALEYDAQVPKRPRRKSLPKRP